MSNPYHDKIQPDYNYSITPINTTTEYPYDNGHLIKRDAEHPFPLNIRITDPGTERIFSFNLEHLESLDTFEITHIINSDATQITYVLSYSFTIDDINWSPFYTNFDTFKTSVNDSITSGLKCSIRVKMVTLRLEPADEETNPTTSNPRDKNALYEVIIDRFLINGLDTWTDDENLPHPYVPCYIEVVKSLGLNRDLTSNLFNPYANMDKAHQIQLDTSKAFVNMWGLWVYWFRTTPDDDSKSATFRQYRLKNVTDLKKIKIVIPDNNIPTNRNTFSEWGIQFADEFTIHVLNEFFFNAFGQEEIPHTDDYLFIPLTNRMYTVNTATDLKKFMYKSVYTECILVKYEDNEIVDDNAYRDSLLEYIDVMTSGGPEILEAEERQMVQPDYLDLRRYEKIRTFVHQSLQITNNQLKINGVEIFNNMYLFSAILSNNKAVSYNTTGISTKNLGFSFWFLAENSVENRTIVEISNQNVIQLSLQSSKLRLGIGNRSVAIDISAGILYHVSMSVSTDLGFFSLMVYRWNQTEMKLEYQDYKFDALPTISSTLSGIDLYGGKHLIAFVRLDNYTLDQTNIIPYIMTVHPDAKTNYFTDKCTPTVSQSRTIL